MSRFLLVAATSFEIEPVIRHFDISVPTRDGLLTNKGEAISVLITGVGMVNTAYGLGQCREQGFDYVINAGICGAFDRNIPLGEVVQVVSEVLSEMGAENDNNFLPYAELNLQGTNAYRNILHGAVSPLKNLRQVNGITVNKVHGNETSIKNAVALFNPDVESMEGAAFFRSCAHFKGNCLQIRSISNYVEKRDKSKWNIPLALDALNNFLIQFINELAV